MPETDGKNENSAKDSAARALYEKIKSSGEEAVEWYSNQDLEQGIDLDGAYFLLHGEEAAVRHYGINEHLEEVTSFVARLEEKPRVDWEFYERQIVRQFEHHKSNCPDLIQHAIGQKLKSGELKATGLERSGAIDDPPKQIDARRWESLRLNLRLSSAAYQGDFLDSILLHVPAGKTTGSRSSKHKHPPYERLRQFVERYVQQHPDNGSKNECWELANVEFKHLSVPKSLVFPLCDELKPGGWRPGRKPKRSSKAQ
jgi:hypothetical protein